MQYPDATQPDRFDSPIFEALLTPYRSLGRTGFTILMSVLITCWLFVSTVFWSLGAWPIFGFFGLDVLLIYLAFRWNYRAARAREEISVSRSTLLIRQYAASGKMTAHSFNPFWTRFNVARKPDIGITSMRVESRGDSVIIGSFLNPDDRESFASAFGKALSEAKR
ncbi:DUF2244 domain-containing protein [Falsochrobactrum shanghaiense]|uniref:DUF2244 domain-containing protein n=1 Tax=Falsochrobactrum shanghaiense TaxID=2201899 RepID=A0A316JBS6_9HYPH|nr:DUF2244 domain-containing protein [Falsochrobactrum shanghaiense]PWL19322.1 DUF2244 domain-containing protein [Falsochrobactrum shanghaiense]